MQRHHHLGTLRRRTVAVCLQRTPLPIQVILWGRTLVWDPTVRGDGHIDSLGTVFASAGGGQDTAQHDSGATR
jgi:hypothetical protein